MKKLNKSVLYKICTLCLALNWIIYYRGPSLVFFGEPDYPTEK